MTKVPSLQRLAIAVIAFLATLLVWTAWFLFPSLLNSWEWSTYDARLRWREPAPASPHIVIIGRDAESDARFGVGIWDRALFAKVIEGLGQAGAVVIAPDFHFAGTSPPERGGSLSDEALIRATQSAGTVIYPVHLTVGSEGHLAQPDNLDPPLRELLLQHTLTTDAEFKRRLSLVTGLGAPLLPLLQQALGVGHMAALPDADGVYRQVTPYVNLDGQALPSFAVAIASAFWGLKPEQITVIPGEAVVFHDARFPDGTVRTLTIPTDDRGNVLVNYVGRWTDGPFPYFSFVDVYDAIKDGDIEALRAQVSGKVVLLLHAAIEADKRKTPLELKAPGGFIHANILNTLLTGQSLRETSLPSRFLLTLTVALLTSSLLFWVHGWAGLVGVAGFAAIYTGGTYAAFASGGVVLPILAPLSSAVLSAGGTMAWTGFIARHRIGRLEGDITVAQEELTATRQALAKHESIVEQLEEDLEAAQAEAAASAGTKEELVRQAEELKRRVTQEQTQVETARQELQELERRLADLMAATVQPFRLSSAEWERVRQECEQTGILTQSQTILSVFRDLKKAAVSGTPILLLGETGTGKELFAQAAHRLSARAKGPFVAVNVPAISADLVESEIFGHVQGAFTGAVKDRKGYFQQAHQGTIFLDEIGDLRPEVQVKLLRVLQEGTFYRVGDTAPTKVDVRIIAATNKDLLRGVAQGWFREDLYFRIQGIELRLPPLRERKGDIPLLAERFIQKFAQENGRVGLALSKAALEAIERCPWKGNVRELMNCLQQATVLAEGRLIAEQNLRLNRHAISSSLASSGGDVKPALSKVEGASRNFDPASDASGDSAVLSCLRQHGFDMQATAQALGWDRSTVTQRLKGMCFRALVEHGGDRHVAAAALAGEPTLTNVVAVKLNGYLDHLLKVVEGYSTAEEAMKALSGRLKNLPDRHLSSVESLVRQHFKMNPGRA